MFNCEIHKTSEDKISEMYVCECMYLNMLNKE